MSEATEQIRRAAVRAGLMGTHGTSVPMHKLEAFAAYLLDEENEACAQACEQLFTNDPLSRNAGRNYAKAIRARRKA